MKRVLFAGMVLAAAVAMTPIRSNAVDPEFRKVRCTCYIEQGVTYSGHDTHKGIIAGRKEDIGKVAALYTIGEDGELGEFIGYFDFYDIGAGADTDGDGKGDSIIKGKSVDVFRDNMDEVWDFVRKYGDYVYIKIIEAAG